jgi:molybdopterin/thiamine biosynthesis adenylyltransferase
MEKNKFDYGIAFDRNIGWLTGDEQEKLKHACVAIAGVGGAGGFQVQTLARLGVGSFRLADMDTFTMSNINRQVGASMSTLGQDKCAVMRQMILDINPEAKVEIFSKGIDEQNINTFLEKVDLALDGIDLYQIETKRLLFRNAKPRGIPVLTCAPMGFGAAVIIFSPTGMTFDEYFNLSDGMDNTLKVLKLIAGINPALFGLAYIDRKRVLNAENRRGASVCPGLMLVGAMSGTEAVKILTGKAKVSYAPHIYQIDLFTQQVNKKYYPFGMKSPFQRLKRMLLTSILKTK